LRFISHSRSSPSPLTSCAKSGEFRVVGITDGDTIRVLDSSYTQIIVRLAGIDAPEHNQAFGTRSRQNLAALVFGKPVRLRCQKEESYNRKVCTVYLLNGDDVCLDQVKAGLAWHYKQFQYEQSLEERAAYAAAEDSARLARLGLWSEPNPTPPWDFRHRDNPPNSVSTAVIELTAAHNIRDQCAATAALTSTSGRVVHITTLFPCATVWSSPVRGWHRILDTVPRTIALDYCVYSALLQIVWMNFQRLAVESPLAQGFAGFSGDGLFYPIRSASFHAI
jgi:endonuclease YncB( thermonuclease family)